MLTLLRTELIFEREAMSSLSNGIDCTALVRAAALEVPCIASLELVLDAAGAEEAGVKSASIASPVSSRIDLEPGLCVRYRPRRRAPPWSGVKQIMIPPIYLS
jgi:hypothetical protein